MCVVACSQSSRDLPLTTQIGYINVEGGNLYYEEVGSGDPLVFIGGGGMMDSRQWDDYFNTLKKDYRVIKIDPRGVGRSSLPQSGFSNAHDIHAVLDSLGVQQATLIGLSYSGGIALDMAIENSENIKSIIISGPSVSGWQGSESQNERNRKFGQAFQQGKEAFMKFVFEDPHFMPSPAHEIDLQRAKSLVQFTMDSSYFYQFSRGMIKTLNPPAVEQVDKIAVPVYLVYGDADNEDVKVRIQYLHDKIGNSKVFEIEHAGHMNNLENKDRFLEIIRASLE